MATCSEVAGPPLANVILPGLALASATSSCTVFQGAELCTTSGIGVVARLQTGSKFAEREVAALHRHVDHEGVGDQQHGVAVRLGARRGVGADGHAAAGAVLDHDGRAAGLADLLAHQAGDDVGAAARRVGNDDLERLRLRERTGCAKREHGGGGAGGRQDSEFCHRTLPFTFTGRPTA